MDKIGDAIKDAILGPIFGPIITIFKNVSDIPSSINFVINFFKCPFNILSHIDKCIPFYLIDLLLFLIYIIVVALPIGLIYCVIILPVICVLNLILPLIGLKAIKITFNDVCPYKNVMGKYLEFLIYKMNNKYFFYRTGNDINDCYCLDGIIKVFDPLQDIFSFSYKSSGGSGVLQLFIFALVITGVILIPGKKTDDIRVIENIV